MKKFMLFYRSERNREARIQGEQQRRQRALAQHTSQPARAMLAEDRPPRLAYVLTGEEMARRDRLLQEIREMSPAYELTPTEDANSPIAFSPSFCSDRQSDTSVALSTTEEIDI